MDAKWWIAASLAMLSTSAVDAGRPQRQACPMLGATYLPRARHVASGIEYRLKVEGLAPGSSGSAVATLWRFQTLAAPGGKVLSELRMYFSCTNGAGTCSVSPSGRPGREGGLYSDVVRLNRDFSPAADARAPYALILPGFADANWTFTRAEMDSPD